MNFLLSVDPTDVNVQNRHKKSVNCDPLLKNSNHGIFSLGLSMHFLFYTTCTSSFSRIMAAESQQCQQYMKHVVSYCKGLICNQDIFLEEDRGSWCAGTMIGWNQFVYVSTCDLRSVLSAYSFPRCESGLFYCLTRNSILFSMISTAYTITTLDGRSLWAQSKSDPMTPGFSWIQTT